MGSPIVIPGLDQILRNNERYGSYFSRRKRKPSNHDVEVDDKPSLILRGLAASVNRPFPYANGIYVFCSGCFDEHADAEIGLRIDHNPSSQFASVRFGECFRNMEAGLVLQYAIPPTRKAHDAVASIDADGRIAMSVGLADVVSETRRVAGFDVEFVTKAKLEEVSICRQGAVRQAFCNVVDAKHAMPIDEFCVSAEFGRLAAFHNVQEHLARLLSDLGNLKADHVSDNERPAKRACTLADSNRWQQERHEELAKQNRTRWWF